MQAKANVNVHAICSWARQLKYLVLNVGTQATGNPDVLLAAELGNLVSSV